ncbi:MAG: phosphotransferase [Bacteriovoracaceae bacterium]|nr:phosphotransferase [Bacteriovoracaceae bacterium]
MGSYTKIDKNIAQSIIDQYGLGEVTSLRALSLGISNSNYKLTTADKSSYLLKISNDKSSAELKEEMEIMSILSDKRFPYSLTPFKTKKSKLVYFQDDYFGVIFPFVEGIPPGPADMTCRMIGEGLATLHSIKWSKEDLESIRPYEAVGYGPDNIIEYLDSSSCPEDFKKEFNKAFPNKLEHWKKAKHEIGLVHGDLYYDNTLFHNDILKVMLDFEQSGTGELLLDLGICISGTCLEKGHIITPLIDSFLSGYESIRPLPEIEKKMLDQAISLGLFSISLWRIKRFTEGSLNTLMADSYKELIQRANNYRKESGGSSRK